MKRTERKELMRLVENQRDYAERAKRDRWVRFDSAKSDAIISALQGLDELPQTPIGIVALHDSYQDMQDAKSALEQLIEERDHVKSAICSARDGMSRNMYHGAPRPGHEEMYSEWKRAYEERRAQWRDEWSTDEFTRSESNARAAKKIAEKTYQTMRMLHVYQCATLVYEALLSNTSWAKWPTHYKHARTRIESIANNALLGTGCTCSVTESGKVSVNHSHAQYFTHIEYKDDVEIDVPTMQTDRYDFAPDVDAMRASYERHARRAKANATPKDVKRLCSSLDSAIDRMESERSAYQAKMRKIMEPYRAIGIGDEYGYFERFRNTHI